MTTNSYKNLVWGQLKLDIEEGSVLKAESTLDDLVWRVNDADESDGETALIRAAVLADEPAKIEIMEMLINRGADIEARKKDGSTALSEAVKMGYTPAARLLLEKGAKVDAPTKEDKPALYYALDPVTYEPGMTKLLLEFGASTAEMAELCGDLALNIAASEHNRFAVVELMNHGEDPRVPSPFTNLTALEQAFTFDKPMSADLKVGPVMRAMLDARLAEESIEAAMKRAHP